MRRLFFIVWLGLAILCLAASPCSTDAATIEGRVIDSSGKPIARAEVRIWQTVGGARGRFGDQPVEFDGSDMLLTDAQGRFASPDVFVSPGYAYVVAEAGGMVAGRSGWVWIAKDAAAVETPAIVLKALRIVTGRVLDRRGQPVDGAVVFNSGDGHERVEATSKGGGKFLLTEVPEGDVFLFAEKPGYRFTGVRLPTGQAEAMLRVTSLDEPAEPKTTLPPLLPPEEEYALARAVLDPWLERLKKSGTPKQRILAFNSLAEINGLEAFRRLDWSADMDERSRDVLRSNAVLSVIAHRGGISWDELRAIIDAGDDKYQKATEFILAVDTMNDDESAMRLEWLESAVGHARQVDDPARRVRLLASVSERLFGLGEVTRSRAILAEAEDDAKPLFPDVAMQLASLKLALAAVHDDADRAIAWLDKAGLYAKWHGGRVAAGLLPDHPQQAVEAWQRAVEANRKQQARTAQGLEYRAAAEFCYRLALVDRPLAERVVAEADEPAMRYRGKGAIVLALAQTQPAEARRLMEALVREELPRLPAVRSRRLALESAPAIAAWLLPVAERVAPELCGELLWRSLALRPPRPRRDALNDRIEATDFALAKLLARYDRDLARALVESLAAKASTPGTVESRWISWKGIDGLFPATVYVDPRWAKSFLDSPSVNDPDDSLRFYFIHILALPYPERWNGPDEFSAGFWEPSRREKPLPP